MSLFSRRLIFVVGKGGVGKSVVAAALATVFVARRKRTLLAGLGAPPLPVPGATCETVDGESAFGEYLETILPDAVAHRISRSGAVRRFTHTAPGLRELMAIGKLAHEERTTRWDHLVVDMPATGHALEALRMPSAAGRAFGGLVRWEGDRIERHLTDPARTGVCLVTLAEELPVRETLEAEEELRMRLALPVAALVINAVHSAPVLPAAGARPLTPLAAAILACAREEAAWTALNRRWIAELGGIAAPAAQVPWMAEPKLTAVAEALEAQLA